MSLQDLCFKGWVCRVTSLGDGTSFGRRGIMGGSLVTGNMFEQTRSPKRFAIKA